MEASAGRADKERGSTGRVPNGERPDSWPESELGKKQIGTP